MKHLSLLIIPLFMACGASFQAPPPQTVDYETFPDYWGAFQETVSTMDTTRLANLTHFPLAGAGYLAGNFDQEAGLERKAFIKTSMILLDSLVLQTIINTNAEQVASFLISEDAYANTLFRAIGVEDGEQIRRLDVRYVFEEAEGTTESSVSFCFAKIGGYYRFCRILLAG